MSDTTLALITVSIIVVMLFLAAWGIWAAGEADT